MPNPSDVVFDYHHRTKHRLNAYAKGPASLDWDDQPDPFRRFRGCDIVEMPMPGAELDCLFADLDIPERIPLQLLNPASLGLLLELAFGISAWKQYGPDRWALRCNPSSGNLHPTEAYIVCTDGDLLPPGVYHYVSYDHYLERRCKFVKHDLPPVLYVGLTSIHWREAWKYGERAFRYSQLDIGHAIASLSYAAACLGWEVQMCDGVSDADIAACLGIDRREDFVEREGENAECFLRLKTRILDTGVCDHSLLSGTAKSSVWDGRADTLSQSHFYRWSVIDEVCPATEKPATVAKPWKSPKGQLPMLKRYIPACRIIRQRRSAQQFNAKAGDLAFSDFRRLMSALQPSAKPPFTAWNESPQVNPVVFVHRVAGLPAGIYIFMRHPEDLPELKSILSGEFVWKKFESIPNLYLLAIGSVKQAARTLSCHQPIAGDSYFSLGMLTRFEANIKAKPWRYRRLFWECGMLGQILYLEAEAAGCRGTGIGCFFDDAVHDLLGISDLSWQSLYHFTLGEPLEDKRLQTFPAYGHLSRQE